LKKFLTATIFYSFFWLAFFFFARVIFLLMQFKEMVRYSFADIIQTFLHGFKMDLSVTAYILILPLFLGAFWFVFAGKWYQKFMKIYSAFLIIFFTLLVLGDAVVYSYWGYRVDFSVVAYLRDPKDAFASASTLQLIGGVSVSAVLIYLQLKGLKWFIKRFYSFVPERRFVLLKTSLVIILTGLLIVPVRGGFGVAPLNAGHVYFSEHLFLNHAALNEVWHFGHSTAYLKPLKNPYEFTSKEEALGNFKNLMLDEGKTTMLLNTQRPNILLIIVESFGSEIISAREGDSVVAPRFNSFIPEGIYFSNFYATGSRTDKAIPAILGGYPNLPTIQVIREPKKTQSMPGIFKMLDSAGYKTSFWYGGNINFANINSFITTTGFKEKVTIDNFERKYRNSKWGAHDHVVFERLYDSLLSVKEPFAYALLTLSSHEPFEVPMKPVFKGNSILSRFKNSIYYTDKSLGEFLDRAKNTEWWKRTLVIIIADHCRRNSETIPAYSETIFRIPMLWLGGAIAVKDTVISKPCSQFDLPATLSAQLNLPDVFPFSKNILSDGVKDFAFYTYNEGFAFITDSSKVIYDIRLNGPVEKSGNWEIAEKYGKSFLQVLFDDYLSR